MENEQRKATAPNSSVDADEEQPTSKNYNQSIADSIAESNEKDAELDALSRKLELLQNPSYMPTFP